MKISVLIFITFCYTLSSQEWSKLNGPFGKSSTEDFLKINDSLFIVTFNDLLLSTDEGENWKSIIELIKNEISNISSVSLINDTLFICTLTNLLSNSKGNIYYQKLNSNKWNKVFTDDESNSVLGLIKSYGRFYSNSFQYGLRYSINLVEWNDLSSYSNHYRSPNTFLVMNDTILTGHNLIRDNDGIPLAGGFLISTDKGENWEIRNIGLGFQTINCLLMDDNILYCGTLNGLYKSTNFGKNWEQLSYFNNKDIKQLVKYQEKIFALSKLDGVYIIENDEYSRYEKILKEDLPKNIRVIKDYIYFVKFGNIMFTNNFEEYSNYYYISDLVTTQINVLDTTLFLSTYNNGIFKYNLNNQEFDIFNDSLFYNASSFSEFILKENLIIGKLYGANSIIISYDFGENWKRVNFNLGIGDILSRILLYENNIIVSTRTSKYLSKDLGQSWEILNTNNEIESSYLNSNNLMYEYNGLIYCYGNGVMTYDIESNKASFYIDTVKSERMFFSVVKYFKKYNDVALIGNGDGELIISYDEKNWEKVWKIDDGVITNIERIKDVFIIKTNNGIFKTDLSFENIENIIFNLPESNQNFGKIRIIYDKLYSYYLGIYTIPLEDLGIEYTSVEKTEKRNYLYTHPPFPQPTRGEIKIKTFWDSGVSFSPDDVNLYDINGSLIDIIDFKIINDTYNTGHIIFNTSNLNPGVYFVKINHGTEMRVCKILVN